MCIRDSVDTDDDNDKNEPTTTTTVAAAAAAEEQVVVQLPSDFTLLTSVACGPRRGEDGNDTDQTLAPRPKRKSQHVKGKGLRLLDNAQPGDLLCEYTGQAIREGALGRLFRRYTLDRRLYILALGDGVYISRAAVVALTAIPSGTELTFDYQWEPKEGQASRLGGSCGKCRRRQ